MKDGGVEELAALREDLVSGGASVGRGGVVEGGHLWERGLIVGKGLRERGFGGGGEADVAGEESAHHHLQKQRNLSHMKNVGKMEMRKTRCSESLWESSRRSMCIYI